MIVQWTDPSSTPARDPAMPQLAEALDPAAMADRLRSMTGAELECLSLRRHKPGRRALIEYRVRRPDGGRCAWLGKLRAKGLDRRTYELHRELCGKGLDDRTPASTAVPRAVCAMESLGMWLQERVPGDGIEQSIRSLPPEEYARRAARAIHALHRAPVTPDREHSAADEMAILQARLTNRLPAGLVAGERIARLLAACARLAATLPTHRSTPIHRDFYHDQLLLTPDRAYLLDLDLCCLGDPAVDLGNFIAHLLELAIREHAAGDWLRAAAAHAAHAYCRLNSSVLTESIATYATLALARHVQICTEFEDRTAALAAVLQAVEQRLEGDEP